MHDKEIYLELMSRMWELNRVHNSDDTVVSCQFAKSFCDQHLSGESLLHYYRPGDEFNYWIVPYRWNLRSYELKGPDGTIVSTLADSVLAVGSYSDPIDITLTREELLPHIISNQNNPDAYYFHFRKMYRHWEQDWSISLPHKTVEALKPGKYHVKIVAEISDQPMPVFEYVRKGRSDKTIVLPGHIDHPGMVNDSL